MASILTVQVQQLELYWSVGILDFEKTAPQKVWISVDADVEIANLDGSETYADVLCYASIVDFIKTYSTQGHVDLLETIAHHICLYVLSHRGVKTVKVSIYKPNIIDECHAVGVTLTKSNT